MQKIATGVRSKEHICIMGAEGLMQLSYSVNPCVVCWSTPSLAGIYRPKCTTTKSLLLFNITVMW